LALKISIITAVYNAKDTIADAIESVLLQSYGEIEYIIIDGGSNDGTIDIIKSYGDKIHKFVSKKDNGIYDALNKGIALASGDVIGFLHSDDVYNDTRTIERIAREFSKAQNIDGVYGDLLYVQKHNTNNIVRYWKSKLFSPSLLKAGWMPPHPTLFLKKEVYDKYKSFDLSFKIASDYDFMLRVLSGGANVVYIDDILYKMRVGGESNKSVQNIWLKTKEDYKALKKNNIGGVGSLVLKNLSKIMQFLNKPNNQVNNKSIAFYHQSDNRVKNDYFLEHYDNTNEYVRFAKELKKDGYRVHSLDIYQKQNIHPQICIFLDVPTLSISQIVDIKNTKTIAMLREAELINKINYDTKKHKEFDIILTYKRALLDNKKYLFCPSTRFLLENKLNVKNIFNRKLLVLINSNLTSNIQGELYSHRLKAIEWFEENNLDDFDLWGYGWDEYRITLKGRTIFKSKLFAKRRGSYKGIADDKLKTMNNYKFAICFENTNMVEDYITEKIFDCFLSQCVPIYWGAPNIDALIPKECFIDFREFRDFDKLYRYIKNMSDREYTQYINSINEFLHSDKSSLFTLDNWVKCVKTAILQLRSNND